MKLPDFGRIREMVHKELVQVRRDPRLMRIVLIAPMMQLVVFGYAVSTDVRNTKMFVVDQDRSRPSRDLVAALTASGYFRVVGRSDRPADLADALDRGRAVVGVHIPVGFARDLRSGGGAGVQILVDGTNSNVATVALGYAERIYRDFAAREAGIRLDRIVDLRDRAWYNPNLSSTDYNVPAVMGALILIVCLLLTSLAVVRERELGTLEQLMVSPLRPIELVLGKAIPFGLLGFLDLILVGTVAIAWFGVPFRGSFAVLALASLLYILCALGIGLLLSTISKTQQEAFMSAFLLFMPTLLLSGFMFPVTSMPAFFRWATLVNPVRHYMEIVRAVFLQGSGLEALWPQHLALLALGTIILGLAASRFRKRLD